MRGMTDLEGLRILVVEDELIIALNLEDMLGSFGCEVVGPFAHITEAELAGRAERLDGALLDVNVRGRLVYPVAEILLARGIPVLFCSGYSDTSIMPERFARVAQMSKPYAESSLREAMIRAFARKPVAARG
jgi:CheY-like chemotaxis protein